MTRSTVSVSVLPSLVFNVAVTLSAPFSSFSTVVATFSFMPCLAIAGVLALSFFGDSIG